MLKRFGFSFVLAALYCVSHDSLALQVSDDFNQSVILSSPAKRIISLAPHLTQTLIALHAENKLIGCLANDQHCKHLNVATVGNYSSLDIEKIISLHPDLILNWDHNFIFQLQKISQFNIGVYHSAPQHLMNITKNITDISRLIGNEQLGRQLRVNFIKQLSELLRPHRQIKKVFFQIGNAPLYTFNHASWINDAIEICGGKNIFATVKLASFSVSTEDVLAANPDIIIGDSNLKQLQNQWQKWPTLKAACHAQIYTVNPDLIEQPGLHILRGIRKLCAIIQD